MALTKTYSPSRSTVIRQTHHITIPEISKVSNVTVNNGVVSNFSLFENTVTVVVDGGNATRVQTGGSYTPAASKTVTYSSYRDHGSSYYYNSDGYSGTIPFADKGKIYGEDVWTYYYQGRVHRPARDTRVYTNYYQYVITVSYVDAPDVKFMVSGSLKEFGQGWVRVNGELKDIASMWIKINGVLKEV